MLRLRLLRMKRPQPLMLQLRYLHLRLQHSLMLQLRLLPQLLGLQLRWLQLRLHQVLLVQVRWEVRLPLVQQVDGGVAGPPGPGGDRPGRIHTATQAVPGRWETWSIQAPAHPGGQSPCRWPSSMTVRCPSVPGWPWRTPSASARPRTGSVLGSAGKTNNQIASFTNSFWTL